jgi:cysteinyl-tRNA synthetase
MDDDFNTSAAIASIFSPINSSNRFLEDAAKPSKEVSPKHLKNIPIKNCSPIIKHHTTNKNNKKRETLNPCTKPLY